MATTFSILGSGLSGFKQNSAPAITPIASWATDGETTNLTIANPTTTGCSATANVSDNDGGTDAVTITVSSAGTSGNSSVSTTGVTFYDGTNVISARFKSNSGAAWLRIAIQNLTGLSTTDYDIWINISTGSVGNTAANISSASLVSEGNGWYAFSANWDLSAITSDATGNIFIYFTSADNTTTDANRNGTDNYSIHDFLLGSI